MDLKSVAHLFLLIVGAVVVTRLLTESILGLAKMVCQKRWLPPFVTLIAWWVLWIAFGSDRDWATNALGTLLMLSSAVLFWVVYDEWRNWLGEETVTRYDGLLIGLLMLAAVLSKVPGPVAWWVLVVVAAAALVAILRPIPLKRK